MFLAFIDMVTETQEKYEKERIEMLESLKTKFPNPFAHPWLARIEGKIEGAKEQEEEFNKEVNRWKEMYYTAQKAFAEHDERILQAQRDKFEGVLNKYIEKCKKHKQFFYNAFSDNKPINVVNMLEELKEALNNQSQVMGGDKGLTSGRTCPDIGTTPPLISQEDRGSDICECGHSRIIHGYLNLEKTDECFTNECLCKKFQPKKEIKNE